MSAAVPKRLAKMIPGSARNWITVNAVQQSNLNEKMKQKTLIYMVIKPSIVLAAAVLTAASFLAPSAVQRQIHLPDADRRGGGHPMMASSPSTPILPPQGRGPGNF